MKKRNSDRIGETSRNPIGHDYGEINPIFRDRLHNIDFEHVYVFSSVSPIGSTFETRVWCAFFLLYSHVHRFCRLRFSALFSAFFFCSFRFIYRPAGWRTLFADFISILRRASHCRRKSAFRLCEKIVENKIKGFVVIRPSDRFQLRHTIVLRFVFCRLRFDE